SGAVGAARPSGRSTAATSLARVRDARRLSTLKPVSRSTDTALLAAADVVSAIDASPFRIERARLDDACTHQVAVVVHQHFLAQARAAAGNHAERHRPLQARTEHR